MSLKLSMKLTGKARLREQTMFYSPPTTAIATFVPTREKQQQQPVISPSPVLVLKTSKKVKMSVQRKTHVTLSTPSNSSQNIICGRGGESNNHEGNRIYRGLARCLADAFERAEGLDYERGVSYERRAPYMQACIETLAAGGMRFIDFCQEKKDGSFEKTNTNSSTPKSKSSKPKPKPHSSTSSTAGAKWMQNMSRKNIMDKVNQFFRDAMNSSNQKKKKPVAPLEALYFCELGAGSVFDAAVEGFVGDSTKILWLNALEASIAKCEESEAKDVDAKMYGAVVNAREMLKLYSVGVCEESVVLDPPVWFGAMAFMEDGRKWNPPTNPTKPTTPG
ncbi:hypothetical protein TL16_g00537 [Triparma laevis f. inornata]|uniref:Uncharacterized protein n=1 Tax=Triparma laevis f. inornata TaxID=1714386 RepID=A0A9W7DNH6_9STRA|nr:hypothetical protein TL16_g00537 [Triparma laevis f. inornata]